MVPDRTIFDPCPYFDMLIVPGELGVFNTLEDATVVDWIKEQRAIVFPSAQSVMTCSRLERLFVEWQDGDDVLDECSQSGRHVQSCNRRSGTAFISTTVRSTTTGVTAGIDLTLALIDEDCGKKMALDVAKYLIVCLRHSGR